MGFTPYTGETDYISKLDDLPNDVGGLTASELKAMFDRYGKEFTEWFNTVHLGEVTLPRLGGSNKNLLDNADFRNPVNQRGLTTYSFTNYSYGYSLDRYVIFSGVSGTITLTKNTGYITLAATNTNGGMNQYLETVLRDGNYTFTVKLSNGIYYSKIFSVSGTTVTFVSGSTPTGLNLVLGYDGTQFFAQVYITAGYSFNLSAIKLELGSVSTLANDPPADFGEELRKCQRYAIKVQGTVRMSYYGSNIISFCIPLPTTPRSTGNIETNHFEIKTLTAGAQTGFTFAMASIFNNCVEITATKTSHGLTDALLECGGTILSFYL